MKWYLQLLTTCAFLCVSSQTINNHTLYLGVFLSINSSVVSTIGFLPALDIAIETVNNHPEVLKSLNGVSYRLDVVLNDSRCDAPASLRGFIDQIFFEPIKIMLIGSPCSVSAEPLAELSPYWNLVQISPAATSSRLSDTSIFPRFLRTVPSDVATIRGVAAVMRRFGWSRIALLTQVENLFTFFAADLREHFQRTNLRVTHEFQFNTNGIVTRVVQSLQNSPVRVVFINMYPRNALQVICQAYRNGLVHPDYVYMFHNWYSNEWWDDLEFVSNCTVAQIQRALRFSLLFDHYPRLPEDEQNVTNIGNLSFDEYKVEYMSRLEVYREQYPAVTAGLDDLLDDSVYVFDAVWAAALALHNTSKAVTNETLQDFNYNSQFLSEAIYNQTLKTDFFGLSGRVTFNSIGDRSGFVRFLQYRGRAADFKAEVFAVESGNGSGLMFLEGEGVTTVYPGEDAIPQDEEHSYIAGGLFVVYTVLSFLGIVFACVTLGFNLWFRNQPYVKHGGPYISILIIVGAVIFYVTVVLFGVDENIASDSVVDGLCQTRVWLSVIAFSLFFGTIFAKVWKIFHIHRHSTSNSVVDIREGYLFIIVGVLIVIDLLFMIPSTAVDDARLQRHLREIDADDNDGSLPVIIGVCDADKSLEWLSVLFAYKGFVLLVGSFLAFETRKVTFAFLSDARFVAMSVYGAAIVSVALTPIGFLLEDFPNAQFGILGIMALLSVSIILGLLFVSKMYKVYMDPNGEMILLEINNQSKNNSSDQENVDYNDDAYRSKVEMINQEIFQLRSEIKQEKYQSQVATNVTNGTPMQ